MVSMSSLRRGFILGYTLPSILVCAIIKKNQESKLTICVSLEFTFWDIYGAQQGYRGESAITE